MSGSTTLMRILKPERYRWCDFMRRYERASAKECKDIQHDYLQEMLRYAVSHVPWYRENGPNIDRIKSDPIEALRQFPLLTKDDIRTQQKDLHAENFQGRWYKNTSGGSTGEPVLFLQDDTYKEKGAAAKMLFFNWAGRDEGESVVRLWGSERDARDGAEGLKGWVQKRLLHTTWLNSFRMSEEDMRSFVDTINTVKPAVIEAYAHSIYELARFIESNNVTVHFPKGIVTSAGMLYPDMKEKIQQIFQCEVLNRYGSREIGDMACTCREEKGFHINIFNHYLEILNEQGKPCAPGEVGNVYVTSLHNKVMPLIRYKIGDMATATEYGQCSCGRGLPLIKDLRGREVNMFQTSDDTRIDGEYFTHLFYFRDWIKQFQIIQDSRESLRIKIVKNSEPNKSDQKEIEKNIKSVMGQECEVQWEFVDEIAPTESGKHLYTISNV